MITPGLRKWLAFGGGIGISIEGPRDAQNLRVVAVRVRPTGAKLVGELLIEDFHAKPAAEWGARISAMAAKAGMRHVAATVMLPRHEVILRQLQMPGVAGRDLDSAVAFQLDGLHPFSENEVVASWARLEGSSAVAVAVVRRERVDAYTTLFAEAGIKLAGFTCSGIAVHSALRLFGGKPAGPLLATEWLPTGVEVYGESPSKPLLSAAFDLAPDEAPDRALAMAAAELRLEPEGDAAAVPAPLSEVLHAAPVWAYVAGLSSAYPGGSSPLNLLPVESRQVRSVWGWVPTVTLASAALLAVIALVLLPGYRNGQYLNTLNENIALAQPKAERAAGLDNEIRTIRERTALLDEVRRHSKADMDVLAAMTVLLEPPTWVRSMEITAEQVRVVGEAPQAAPLLKLIDGSPLFDGSEFLSPPSRSGNMEMFNIRSKRIALPLQQPVAPAPAPAGDQTGASKQ